MAKLDDVLDHEQHEQTASYVGAAALFAVIALIVAAWVVYL